MTKAWLPLGLIAGGWFFQRSYQANSWPKRAETYGAEEEEEDWEYHVYVSDSPTDDIFIVHNARDFETKEDAIKAAHEVSKDKRGKGKMVYVVAEEREMDIEEVIYRIDEDGDVLRAETFNADLDDDEYPPANPLRIIIGGPPHSGKSTLMNLLEDKFRQYGVSVELRDLDLASKTDLKGGFDINREKKDWTPELAEEAANLFDEPTDDRVILGDSIGLVSQLNEIVSEPADVAILLVGGSYGNDDDEYRSQLNKWERYYDAIDKPVLMVIRSSMNPNEENYFDPHDNFGVIVGLDRPTYQQREEEGKRKGERKISLENACLEGMVFEIAQAYDLRLENEITPAHKDNIKRVWPTIQSHRGKPKNPIFIKIEDEYYQQKGWNAEFDAEEEDWQTNDEFWEYMYLNYGERFDEEGHIEMTNSELRKIAKKQGFAAEKKNCGCGKDPCVTYGADYIPSNDPSYEDSVKEFEKLKSKIPSMEVRSALAYADAKNRAIERIAKEAGVPTLETRNLDRLDFYDNEDGSIAVWNLKDMLSKSYDEGYEKGVLKWKGYSQMREGMGAESDAYAFAYNEGHSDSRKKGSYHPTLETKRDEAEFRKVLKQRAETFNAETKVFNASMYKCPECSHLGYVEDFRDWDAENFNSKEAPPLESYTKDELIDSIAGPQGSATYDEMEYDPVAQSRLSAEAFDPFTGKYTETEPPTIVLVDLSGSGWHPLDNGQTIIAVVAEQVKNIYDNRVGDMIIVGYGSSGGDMELALPYGRYTRILSPDGGTRTNFLKAYGGKSDWSSMGGEMPITKEFIDTIMDYMGLSDMQRSRIRIISFSDGILELPNR